MRVLEVCSWAYQKDAEAFTIPVPLASSFTLPEHIPVPNWHFWFADSHCHKPESKTHLALAPARRRDDQEKEKKGFCLELASYFVHLFIQFYM